MMPEGKRPFEHLGIERRLMLKRILNKSNGRV
jgi:hypothetical protein